MGKQNNREEELKKTYEELAEAVIILSPIGPLYVLHKALQERKAKMQQHREDREDEELEALRKLQMNIEGTITSFQIALESTSCSLCRSILNKIKQLPLEQQAVALHELRQYLSMAEQGKSETELKSYLEGTNVLKNILKEMAEEAT